MGRSIGAVVFGVIVACLWIMALEWVNHLCFPLPADLQLDDRQAVARVLADNPAMLMGLAVAYFVGTFMGGWISGRTARRKPIIHGLIVGLIMLGIGIVNLLALPHPLWFWIVGLATFLIAASLGGWAANRTPAPPAPT